MNIEPSARLHFQLMNADDAALLFELDQDPEVMRHINGGKLTTMADIEGIFMPRMQSYRNERNGWGLWKVTVTESLDYIGWVLVRPMAFFTDSPQPDNLELGWRFKRACWGKGYASEAASTIMKALCDQHNISRFSAIALPQNSASVAVMKKLGMNYQKTAVHQDPIGNVEVVYYEMSTQKCHINNKVNRHKD